MNAHSVIALEPPLELTGRRAMNIDDFRQMYVSELQELRSVEDQLVQALPKMAEAAQNPQLRQAIQTHIEETRSQ
jgi:ferritin-like metal-binding protein YciE